VVAVRAGKDDDSEFHRLSPVLDVGFEVSLACPVLGGGLWVAQRLSAAIKPQNKSNRPGAPFLASFARSGAFSRHPPDTHQHSSESSPPTKSSRWSAPVPTRVSAEQRPAPV